MALEGIELGLERLVAPWGEADGVSFTLDRIDAEGAHLGLVVERVTLPEPLQSVALSLDCSTLSVGHDRLDCAEGRLSLRHETLGEQELDTDFTLNPRAGRLELTLTGERFAGGRFDLRMVHQDGRWRGAGTLKGGEVATLLGWAALWDPSLESWKGAGWGTLSFNFDGDDDGLRRLNLETDLRGASLEDPGGAVAAVELQGRIGLQGELLDKERWLRGDLVINGGELYLEPIYWQVNQGPLSATFELAQRPDELKIHRFTWDDPKVSEGSLNGTLARGEEGWRPRAVQLDLTHAEAAPAYVRYLRPLVADHHLLGQLEVDGGVAGRVSWADGRVGGAELRFDRLFVDDPVGRFGLYGLDGKFGWSGDAEPRESDLRWDGGHFFALDLGASELRARVADGRLSLLEEVSQPLLDGTLLVESLDLALADQGELTWELDAVLTPVSMERLSATLGWPAMSGRVSGVIPRLRYENGVMSVGGDLLARLFDGEVLIRDLVLEQPFDPISRAGAEVTLRGLDLDTLTGTFAFGSIQGRLDGEVRGLRLEQWEPVAFDAWFATPEDDDSRHRISQRAVENLSKVGGNPLGGALSRGFLGLFEEFGYDRIGIGCALRDGVCEMEGVAPVNGGYYLVKGGGLPRIDVIGHARRVDWEELISRLRGVTLDSPEIR